MEADLHIVGAIDALHGNATDAEFVAELLRRGWAPADAVVLLEQGLLGRPRPTSCRARTRAATPCDAEAPHDDETHHGEQQPVEDGRTDRGPKHHDTERKAEGEAVGNGQVAIQPLLVPPAQCQPRCQAEAAQEDGREEHWCFHQVASGTSNDRMDRGIAAAGIVEFSLGCRGAFPTTPALFSGSTVPDIGATGATTCLLQSKPPLAQETSKRRSSSPRGAQST